MNTVPCHWCWAEVQSRLGLKHAEWHRLNRLHGTGCDMGQECAAFRSCTCGLEQKHAD